jgi:hypothetical protein
LERRTNIRHTAKKRPREERGQGSQLKVSKKDAQQGMSSSAVFVLGIRRLLLPVPADNFVKSKPTTDNFSLTNKKEEETDAAFWK